ncbi:MAG: hypothetical protein CM15mP62_31940 [Rhodospirillaceae bacterium]|nr:MAG: hypothetical protein CM15mP62_31940 [Rhodospirillaceae bacterium]
MLIQTQLTTTKASVLNSTAEVTSERLKMMDAVLIDEKRCNHSENELSSELYTAFAAKPDIILIAGASAMSTEGILYHPQFNQLGVKLSISECR